MAGEGQGKVSARGGALDALRFLASAFIVLFHFGPEAPTPLAGVHEIFGRGYLATDFFLMLSGFVLAHAYGGAVSGGAMRTGPFILRRLRRIYPAHLITLAALVAIVVVAALAGRQPAHPEHFEWAALAPNLLLVHAWGYGGDTWNIPTWTLSALVACYLGFPTLWRVVSAARGPLLCLALFVSVILTSNAACLAVLGHEEFELPFRYGLVRAIPLFVAGVLLARLCQNAALSKRASLAVGLAGLAAFVLEELTAAPDVLRMFAIGAVMVGCGQAVSRPSRVVEWAGKLSFSLFITHTIAGLLWFDLIGEILLRHAETSAAKWTVWAGSLVFALACAALFHHLVDQPIQRWLGARSTRARVETLAAQPA
jgi:peptidoglycan/LPS O-acetylase OafA/YrhL